MRAKPDSVAVYDVPPGVFMVMELEDGVLRGYSGTIKYHEVFSSPGSSDGSE